VRVAAASGDLGRRSNYGEGRRHRAPTDMNDLTVLRLLVFIEVLIGADVADAPLRKAERFRLPQRDTQCGAAVLIQRAAETPGIDALSDPLEDAIFDVAENRVAVHGKQRLNLKRAVGVPNF